MGCDLQKQDCGGLTRLATGHHLHHPELDSREFWSSPPWWSRCPADSASPLATTGHTRSVRLSSGSATEVGRLPPASHPSFQTILSVPPSRPNARGVTRLAPSGTAGEADSTTKQQEKKDSTIETKSNCKAANCVVNNKPDFQSSNCATYYLSFIFILDLDRCEAI